MRGPVRVTLLQIRLRGLFSSLILSASSTMKLPPPLFPVVLGQIRDYLLISHFLLVKLTDSFFVFVYLFLKLEVWRKKELNYY